MKTPQLTDSRITPLVFRPVRSLVCGLAMTVTCGLFAQNAANPGAPVPNNNRTVVAAPADSRPIRVGLYHGPGTSLGAVQILETRVAQIRGATSRRVTPEEFSELNLAEEFDVVVFGGGAGLTQARALGEVGRGKVREFVREGGGFVGICAGAYLACTGFDWGLGILNARTASPQWRRGRGILEVESTEEGRAILGAVNGRFDIRYNNGPILVPHGQPYPPAYDVIAVFRTEVADNDTPVGLQINSPAFASGTFGRGRVFVSSPHPEDTPGLENVVPRALLWSAGVDVNGLLPLTFR